MKNILVVLFDSHKMWLSYMKSFGCSNYIAEDLVMDMYIKIDTYYKKTNNDLMFNEKEINYYFVYVTLKNIYIDYLRKEHKIVEVDIENINVIDEVKEIDDLEYLLHLKTVKKWVKVTKCKITKLSKIGYTNELATLNYKMYIFDKIFTERISVTKLSNEIGITYFSLYNTIKNIKNEIKEL